MGGAGAPDDLEQGYRTQAWLELQDRLLDYCREVSGVALT